MRQTKTDDQVTKEAYHVYEGTTGVYISRRRKNNLSGEQQQGDDQVAKNNWCGPVLRIRDVFPSS
jgi:hypothetical protein